MVPTMWNEESWVGPASKTKTRTILPVVTLLTIDDDGRGLALGTCPQGGHHGLGNMRARAEALSGTFTLSSEPAGGTRIIVTVPRTREAAATQPMTNDQPAQRLRMLVVDDHEVVRQGLVSLLDRRSGFEVVAQAGSVAESIAQAARFEPDLVIMDVRLPDGSGIEACREIRAVRPETRVVMLTSYPDEEAVLSAIIAGASGYLLKQIRGRELVSALAAVGRGESLLDPAVTEKVLERVRRLASGGSNDELAELTAQERKILLLVADGKTNKEIAGDVFLSDKTVKNYVSSILSKLNLQRRTQAAAFVAKHHLGRGEDS
jgi:two-component system response regulator DevR